VFEKKLTSQLGLNFNKNLTFVHQECVPSKYTTGAVHKPLNFSSAQTIITLQMSGLSAESIQVYSPCPVINRYLYQSNSNANTFARAKNCKPHHKIKLISQCCDERKGHMNEKATIFIWEKNFKLDSYHA